MNKEVEKQPNLINIATKQYHCNVIERKKDIYSDHVISIARTTTEVEAYRKKHDIMVGGDIVAPNPIERFEELKDIPLLPNLLRAHGRPNPMQSQAWPIILSGHDMIGLTRNGHERTLAYILPALLHINKQKKIQPNEGPIVLILTQSKDRGMFIFQVVDLFRTQKHIRRALFTNDIHKLNQMYIRKGIDMVIAVAENALTLLKQNVMNLKFCSMVIVDDFDAQMAATNGEVLREILKYAPTDRQTLWFSQSWFAAAEQLAVEHMPNGYCSVDAGKFHRDVQLICHQKVHILKESECRKQYTLKLIRKIQSSSSGKILIFTVLKEDSISLAKYLKEEGVMAGSLNEVVYQDELQDLIKEFSSGFKTCLVTIDSTVQALADGIEHVIHFSYNNFNYGMRLSHMSYSSTGGTSHVILCGTEHAAAQSVIEQLKYGNQEISTELLHQASYVEKEQSIEEVRPSMENLRHSMEKVRPTIQEVRPLMEKERPSMDNVRPSMEKVRPSIQEVRPSAEEARPSLVKVNDNSKTIPLKVHPHRQIKIVLMTDLKRETIKENSAKKMESNKADISPMPCKFFKKNVATSDKKRIQTVIELLSDAKRRKIANITQILPTDKWIGANDVLRRILIADAKKKSSLSTNAALPLHETMLGDNTLSSRMSMPASYTPSSSILNPGNSIKSNSKTSNSTTTTKRFRYEDLYGISDDSE